jgi:hypothetical protein
VATKKTATKKTATKKTATKKTATKKTATKKTATKAPAVVAAAHALEGAELALTRFPSAPPQVSDEVAARFTRATAALAASLDAESIARCGAADRYGAFYPANAPRMVGPEVAAGLDRDGVLHVLRDGVVRSFRAPGEGHFDVAPDGRRAWLGFQAQLHEAQLDGDNVQWRALTVAGPDDDWVSSVARVDDDHVMVRFGKTLLLLRRDGDTYTPLHTSNVPETSTVVACPQHACVALAAPRQVKLLVVRKNKPHVLTASPLPPLVHAVSGMVRAFETAEGELWLDVNRVEFVRVVAKPACR